jgi:ABC-2 type transport system permease protein
MALAVLLRRSASQAKFAIGGCLCLLAIFQLILVGQASWIAQSNAFGQMANLLPEFLQRGVGSKALLLASFKGTVAFGYFHPVVVVLVSILSVYLATEPAHDVESGLVDLMLARSLERGSLIVRSLLLAAVAPIAATTVMRLGTAVGLRAFAGSYEGPSAAMLLEMQIYLIAVAWSLGAFALAVSAGARRWSTSFTSCALLVVVLYLLDYLALGWTPMRTLSWISPFAHFPAFSILAGEHGTARNLVELMLAAVVFSAIAYWRFGHRDL